jgi:hypothetical protein
MPLLRRIPGSPAPAGPNVEMVLFHVPLWSWRCCSSGSRSPCRWSGLNPRYKHATKLAITVAVIGLTIVAVYAMCDTYVKLTEQLKALGLG